MANSQNAAFFEQYAQLAMEQQQKYGIPASVTLAQAAIESSWGKSACSLEDKNFFGIHATKGWVDSGKPYTVRDDMGKVKFCKYGDVSESFEHHSRFLLENQRYRGCFGYGSDQHTDWAYGICRAGYAHRPSDNPDRYAKLIEDIIRQNGLEKYDQMAIQDARNRGVAIGYAKGQSADMAASPSKQTMDKSPVVNAAYCFPLGTDNLVLTDGYGKGPTGYRSHSHNGIDLRANNQDVFATEAQGRVVAVNNNLTYQADSGNHKKGDKIGSGRYVTVEYDRADGSKWRVSYCHLDSVAVKKGDIVDAGTKLGVSGNTGNSTAPHLHLTVKRQEAGASEFITVNPLNYLAEIAVRGNLAGTVLKKGTSEDLLASRKSAVDTTPTPGEVLLAQRNVGTVHDGRQTVGQIDMALSKDQQFNAQSGANVSAFAGSSDPNNMLSYLMGQNNDRQYSQGGDLFSSLISTLLMSVISLAVQLDGNKETANEQIAYTGTLQDAEKAEEQRAATLLQRQRESVDPVKAREIAMMNFDAEYPQKQDQATVQRIA